MDLVFDVLHWQQSGTDLVARHPAGDTSELSSPTMIYWELVGNDLRPMYPPQEMSGQDTRPIFTSSGRDYSRQEPREVVEEKIRLVSGSARWSLAARASGRAYAIVDSSKRSGSAVGAMIASSKGSASGSAEPFSPGEIEMLLTLLEMEA